MARSIPYFSTFSKVRAFLRFATFGILVCAVPATFAQRGGGAGGHFGGGGHISSPHVGTPHAPAPVSVPHAAPPPTIVHVPGARVAGPPAGGAGTRNFVGVPPRVRI